MKRFLRKEYDNLYTVDLICHGVPSQRMFQDYLATISSEPIDYFVFRDKTRGWKDYFLLWEENNKKKRLHNRLSSYYRLFLAGEISRNCCYSCKFACLERVADITLGDFWGFEKVHPEKMQEKLWKEQSLRGMSCVLLNTNKGVQLFNEIKSHLYWFESSVDKIMVSNGQLKAPSKHTSMREQVLDAYEKKGYRSVEKILASNMSVKQRMKSKLQVLIPLEWKIRLKNFK